MSGLRQPRLECDRLPLPDRFANFFGVPLETMAVVLTELIALREIRQDVGPRLQLRGTSIIALQPELRQKNRVLHQHGPCIGIGEVVVEHFFESGGK